MVATDDERIAQAMRSVGAVVVLTGLAPSGTHRVMLAAQDHPASWVINVQGDMPLVDPAHIALVAEGLMQGHDLVTLATPLADPTDPAVVKAVFDKNGLAKGFSRKPVPQGGPWFRHVGVYGFQAPLLGVCCAAPMPDALRSEDLEQLAWLSAGMKMKVIVVDDVADSIDTPEQLAAMRLNLPRAVDA